MARRAHPGHPMGTRVVLKGGGHSGVVIGHDYKGGLEHNRVRWDDGTVTSRNAAALVPEADYGEHMVARSEMSPSERAAQAMQEASGHMTPEPTELQKLEQERYELYQRKVTHQGWTNQDERRAREVKAGLKRLRVQQSAGVTGVNPAVTRVEKRYNSRGEPRFHLIDERGIVAHNPDGSRLKSYKTKVEAERALSRGTTQSSKSPSSAVPPSQDQRKAAERRADASGATIRPTAASSGKQAADPSVMKHSKTKSQDVASKIPPGYYRGVDGTIKPFGKSDSGHIPGAPSTAPKVKSSRKLSMDPKQVARRAKRGFPNGH